MFTFKFTCSCEEQIKSLEEKLMATTAEIIQEITAQINKSTVEIKDRIAALESALAGQGDINTALADLKAAVDANDAIVPDTTQ